MYGRVLCSALQAKAWYQLFIGEVNEVVRSTQVLESEDFANQKSPVFEVKVKALHLMKALGIYNSDHTVKRLSHTFFAVCAIFFWRKRIPASEMLRLVDYMGVH